MNADELKQAAARAALAHVPDGAVVGVGSGSTVAHFVRELGRVRDRVRGAVSSSERTGALLREQGIALLDLESSGPLPVYVDGADEADARLQLVKGGGAALTREKIVAAVAREFVCIADESKLVARLGAFPLPVEVIPMARSHVGRALLGLGGDPVYRQGVVTDNGNVIIDVHGLAITDAVALESEINNITGVVCNGLFARRPADLLLLAGQGGVRELRATR